MSRDDHYVSQTYLKNFVVTNGDLVPYYKGGRIVVGKPKKPKSVCYETEGDTNTYFGDPRILDKCLPIFENPWTENVNKLEQGYLDRDMKYKFSGYIAFLRTCNPTAKRLGQKALAGVVETSAYIIMESMLNEERELSGEKKSILNKLIRDREIIVDVEREFAHAQGIQSLLGALHRFYCSHWLILHNQSDIPFITSDNPASLYYADNNPQYAQIYVPIKPRLAILIAPDLAIEKPRYEDILGYDNAQDRFVVIKHKCVKLFNTLVVKSAERVVIHSSKEDWLEQLVYKYRNWRVETLVDNLPTEDGVFTIFRQRLTELRT